MNNIFEIHVERMHGIRLLLHTAGVLALVLGGASCKTGPEYKRPSLEIPDGYKSATDSESAEPELTRQWWRLFQDPELTAFCEEAVTANYSLQAAMARVAQSRASALTTKSDFYPVITMDPSAMRSGNPVQTTASGSSSSDLTEVSNTLGQVSSLLGVVDSLVRGETPSLNQGGSTSSTSSNPSPSFVTSNRFQVPFDLSYEIDFWGRVRNAYESAQAQVQATIHDMEVVRQTLLADLANNYFNLRAFDTQAAILERNLALYQEQVDLTRQQYEAGLVNETNTLQAEVQLESTKAQAINIHRQRTNLEHAIAILLGRAPAQFSVERRPLAEGPPAIPVGLPADLLRQRPDIAEAEQNLIAACAEIGVAEADFFPSIKLIGSAGFQSAKLEDVLNWESRTWSFGPSISIPLFKGGRLKAALQKAKARYDELEATYHESILRAFNDVETSMTDLHARTSEAEAQAGAVTAAREYSRLVHIQYETGTIDYLNVINAEQTLLNNEFSEVQTLNQRMISTVLLIKALGGGWNPQPSEVEEEIVPYTTEN
jgi:multidrug efflux system outer membrane protein